MWGLSGRVVRCRLLEKIREVCVRALLGFGSIIAIYFRYDFF